MLRLLAGTLLVLGVVGPISAETRKLAHNLAVRTVAFSPDGKLLATGCQGDATIRIWDLTTGKEAHSWKGPEGGTFFLTFAPDGRSLAGGGKDGMVYLWDPATGKELAQLKGHEKEVQCAAFTPDSKRLASGGVDNTVRIWDLGAAKELSQFTEPNAINALAYSPDGRLLAVAGWFKEVRLYDAALLKLARQCVGHQDSCVSLAFSPDSRLLASGSMEQAIRLWEVASGEEVRKIDEPRKQANALAFSPDGRILLGAFEDRSVRLLDLALLWDPTRPAEVDRNDEHTGPVLAVAISPDGKLVASGATDGKALVRDIAAVYGTLKGTDEIVRPDRLERYWKMLASRNSRQAFQGVWALGMAPKQSMPLFVERLTPFAALMDAQRVGQLITELNHDQYTVREKAQQDLEKMGSLIEPILKKSLMGQLPSLEVRRRLEKLLDKMKADSGASPDVLRASRAVVILERIGTPEARQLLEKFARGMPEAPLTQDAKQAIERLNKRAAAP
jgi:WD40 repeat protein